MKFRYILFVFLIGVMNPIMAGQKEDCFLSTIKNEHDINNIYNYINNIEWTASNLESIKALWEKDTNVKLVISMNKLNNDIIRLALANVLMQASRQCEIIMNIDKLHEFVKSRTHSKNLRIKGKATYLLGLAGYDEDIPFLSSIVMSEKEGYAEEAGLSLTFIHSTAAINALRNLVVTVDRPTLKTFLQALVVKYKNIGLATPKKCN